MPFKRPERSVCSLGPSDVVARRAIGALTQASANIQTGIQRARVQELTYVQNRIQESIHKCILRGFHDILIVSLYIRRLVFGQNTIKAIIARSAIVCFSPAICLMALGREQEGIQVSDLQNSEKEAIRQQVVYFSSAYRICQQHASRYITKANDFGHVVYYAQTQTIYDVSPTGRCSGPSVAKSDKT